MARRRELVMPCKQARPKVLVLKEKKLNSVSLKNSLKNVLKIKIKSLIAPSVPFSIQSTIVIYFSLQLAKRHVFP